jgi:hypothetical protein
MGIPESWLDAAFPTRVLVCLENRTIHYDLYGPYWTGFFQGHAMLLIAEV